MSQLPFDVVRAIYDGLELADTRNILLKLVLVSKAFYAIFFGELYRCIAITTTDPRIARLVKTLQRNPHLKTKVHALTIRLDNLYAPPTAFRRLFNPEEPLDRFARLGAEGQFPNLRCLAFVGERGYHSFTEWTRLSQPIQDLFFRMRCLKTIRSVHLDCVGELNPAMVWGADGYLALDELRVSFLKFDRSPSTPRRPITAPQQDRPHLIRTLSIHSTWMLELNPPSLCHLESFGFDVPQGAKASEMSGIHAIVDACKNTLRQLHMRVVPSSVQIVYCFGSGPPPEPPFLLDLTRYAKLHTLAITSSATPTSINGNLKTYLRCAAQEELFAVINCLSKIHLPPALRKLRVRFHLMDYTGVAEGQGLFDVFSEWGLLPRFKWLYKVTMSPKGGRVQQLEVGITPIPPLQITCLQLRDVQLGVRRYLTQAQGDPELDWISFYLDFDTGPM